MPFKASLEAVKALEGLEEVAQVRQLGHVDVQRLRLRFRALGKTELYLGSLWWQVKKKAVREISVRPKRPRRPFGAFSGSRAKALEHSRTIFTVNFMSF